MSCLLIFLTVLGFTSAQLPYGFCGLEKQHSIGSCQNPTSPNPTCLVASNPGGYACDYSRTECCPTTDFLSMGTNIGPAVGGMCPTGYSTVYGIPYDVTGDGVCVDNKSTGCYDANPNCARWIKNGYCSSTIYTANDKRQNCKKSCKLC